MSLAIMDSTGSGSTETRQNMGSAIIIMSFVFLIIAMLALGLKLVLGIRNAYRISKKNGVKGRKLWLQLLVLPFQ